jgi:hypothetical protein
MKKNLRISPILCRLFAFVILWLLSIFSLKAQALEGSTSGISATNITRGDGVSTQTISNDVWLNVYPNPTCDQANLVFSSSKNDQRYEVSVINSSGISLKEIEGTSVQGENTINVHVGDYPGGVYYVQLVTSSARETIKFLKEPSKSF